MEICEGYVFHFPLLLMCRIWGKGGSVTVGVNVGGSALLLFNLGEFENFPLVCDVFVLLFHHGCMGMSTSAI